MKFEDYQDAEGPKVKCAHCGKLIVKNATTCQHCGVHFRGHAYQFIHGSECEAEAPKKPVIKIAAWGIVLLIVLGVLAMLTLPFFQSH
jgi:ribosomal protein L37AE/L43A